MQPRPADLQARARPLEPPGKRWVREAGILTLLATLANPLDRVEPLGLEPVHEVHSVREPGPAGNGPDRPDTNLPPRGWDHVVIEPGATHSVEGGRLMGLIDDPDRREDQPGADCQGIGHPVVQVRLLQRHLAARLASLELGVFHLELGAKRQPIVKAVGEIDYESGEVRDPGRVWTGCVRVMHLPIAPHRGPFLSEEAAGETGRQGTKKAPRERLPHHESPCRD